MHNIVLISRRAHVGGKDQEVVRKDRGACKTKCLSNKRIHALWSLRVWSLRASTGFPEKIRVCQYLCARIFRGIFQSQYSHFQLMYCKGMVSKGKYWISENDKGDEYSKTPKNP